jgi:methyl-accepting chemotaxis protein
MVAIGLGFSWLIGRSITRPLNGLVTVMKRLANGDTTTRIPATHAHDEIGEMARDNRAVQEFSGTAVGKLRAASTKLETSSADVNKAGDTVSSEAENAKGRVAAASEHVTAAASSVEELAASIAEIASQAAKSTEVAGRAVSEVQRTVTTMMSAIATTVAATVDQQNSAVASIAEGVSRAPGEARMALRQ